MQVAELIIKKRNGQKLSEAEIVYLVDSYVLGQVTDYQMAAWLMAVYFQGLDAVETFALTKAMIESGETISFSFLKSPVADKHSTGGVGDTTTLVLAPLVSAAGVPVAKVSGRGLGFTGGTIDKLESIPGFCAELSNEEFVAQINQIGLAITAQTANLVPADKKIYGLRDVTGTVESLPLIAASIMSKKIAAGANIILLDVKVGKGAFMETLNKATELAQMMVELGKKFGVATTAIISSMEEPLGYAIGNSLEVQEAIDTLKGEGPGDLTELCLQLGAEILFLAKKVQGVTEGQQLLQNILKSGKGLEKFAQLIKHQKGNPRVVNEPSLLPSAAIVLPLLSPRSGYINEVDSRGLGNAAAYLGAGRSNMESAIDLSVGIKLTGKVGDYIEKNDVLGYIYASDPRVGETAKYKVLECIKISMIKVEKPTLILDRITSN
ncbi:MAG: thymidine phosphorylase [Bacillota bacterium]